MNHGGLGRDVIHYGNNSGYQAINLAYLWGFNQIILLGYDMSGKGQHFFGQHPPTLSQQTDYGGLAPLFDSLAKDLEAEGVEVINCTENSGLTCFKKASLKDTLALLSEQAQV